MMSISQRGVDFIKKYEGLRLSTYLCSAKVPTIGYGHTGPEVKMGQTITLERAEELLRKDLSRFEAAVRSSVLVDISQNQYDALVALAYNIGVVGLHKSSVIKKLNAGDAQGAADSFRLWNKATVNGKLTVLRGLEIRREAERLLFLS